MSDSRLPLAPAVGSASGLGRDLISGLVVCLVALPLCLGIAHASGAPLISGLISGIIGGIVVGLLSGSHISVSGPAAGLAAIVVAQIHGLGSFEAFLLAVLMSGALQVALGLIRAGGLANFVPNTVIKGLLAAIGVLLILKQAPHLLGHDADWEGDFSFRQEDGRNTISEIGQMLGAFLPGAALVGLSSAAVLVGWERSRLKKLMFPGALAAMLFGVAVSELLRWTGSSWAIGPSHLVSVPVVGTEGMGWGDLLRLPDFGRWSDPAVLTAAMTLAIVASLETLLNLEATDKLDPLRRTAPPNRELLAQGVGNMLAGLVGGLPMTSVIVRSSVNAQSGARSRVSAIVHGVLLLGSVLLLPELLNHIPLAALAAMLIVTGFKLASPKIFRQMWSEGMRQFLPFILTVAAIVATDLLLGVLIGLGTSIAFILWGNLRSGIRVIHEEHVGGLVHRIELASQANFLNRARLAAALGAFKPGDQVAIDARMTSDIDPDVLSLIQEFTAETAPARSIRVSLAGFRDRYPLQDVQQYVDWTTKEIQASLTPSRVLQLLKEGNERFASDRRLNRDLVRQVDATSAGQHPMAVVLSCIDSRSPAEILFDLGLGDIFNARLAGNVVSAQVLGSIEYACKVAGSKLIVVLGHTRCGAVKATCDLVAKGADAATATGLTNLPSIADTIAEAVKMEARTREQRDGSNEQFVDRVAALNVRNMMRRIEANSPVLRSMILNGEVAMVGAMYDVATGHVSFLDGAGELPAKTAERASTVA